MAEKSTHEKRAEAGRKGSEGGQRHGMSREEAGRLGGEKVAEERGPEFFRRIGKKGGETVAEERGREFYSMIGKLGAKAEPHEAKVRGGEHSHMGSGRTSSGSVSESTREKRAEAGRKGAESQPTEAKRKGGQRS
jgi:general stress protein YciG